MISRIFLPNPISANRYWRHGNGKTYLSKEARAFKNLVMERAISQKGYWSTLEGEVHVRYVYHPKARQKESDARHRRLDLGNVEKVLSDALQGIAFHDDYQIVKLTIDLGEPVKGGAIVAEWWPK